MGKNPVNKRYAKGKVQKPTFSDLCAPKNLILSYCDNFRIAERNKPYPWQIFLKKTELILADIATQSPANAAELETFRIQYLGSKNVIKPLMGEIRNVPNEQKKEYGQLVNEAKDAAERKFAELQEALESASDDASFDHLDLSRPGEPLELGSRHPIATTMNRIVGIFQRMGFAIAEGPDIEDDWHNFTAMNTPEDHPARDMQDTFYLMNSTEMLLRTHTSPVQARVMMGKSRPSASSHRAGCIATRPSAPAAMRSSTK